MKRLLCILLFCLGIQLPLVAQAKLSGQLTFQNSGNQSAYPAQVQSFGAYDTDISQLDGAFELKYGNKKPGQSINITVVKPDYEVVNRKDLAWVLPEDPFRQRRLKLYLCPIGRWKEHADRFYKINYNAVIERYKKENAQAQEAFDTGLTTRETYKAQLEKLEKDRDYAIQEAERLSEVFAKANLDDASERFYQAYQYFSRGLIDSVLIVLNEDEMLEDLYRVDREIENALYLIETGEQFIQDGETLQKAVLQAKAWKDSIEREGIDQYCIRILPDPALPVHPDYPAFERGILRIWLQQHRPNTVTAPGGGDCALLSYVRRACSGKSFPASMESDFWALSNPTIMLNPDTLLVFIRPNGSLATVKGEVVSESGPILGIRVECAGESCLTDEKGGFELKIPLNLQRQSYQVRFFRDGKLAKEIQTTPSTLRNLKVVLD